MNLWFSISESFLCNLSLALGPCMTCSLSVASSRKIGCSLGSLRSFELWCRMAFLRNFHLRLPRFIGWSWSCSSFWMELEASWSGSFWLGSWSLEYLHQVCTDLWCKESEALHIWHRWVGKQVSSFRAALQENLKWRSFLWLEVF